MSMGTSILGTSTKFGTRYGTMGTGIGTWVQVRVQVLQIFLIILYKYRLG